MKKLLAIVLAMVMLVLVGCGDNSEVEMLRQELDELRGQMEQPVVDDAMAGYTPVTENVITTENDIDDWSYGHNPVAGGEGGGPGMRELPEPKTMSFRDEFNYWNDVYYNPDNWSNMGQWEYEWGNKFKNGNFWMSGPNLQNQHVNTLKYAIEALYSRTPFTYVFEGIVTDTLDAGRIIDQTPDVEFIPMDSTVTVFYSLGPGPLGKYWYEWSHNFPAGWFD